MEQQEILNFAKQRYESTEITINAFFGEKDGATDHLSSLNSIYNEHCEKLIDWHNRLSEIGILYEKVYSTANKKMVVEAEEYQSFFELSTLFEKYHTGISHEEERKNKYQVVTSNQTNHLKVLGELVVQYQQIMDNFIKEKTELDFTFESDIQNLVAKLV